MTARTPRPPLQGSRAEQATQAAQGLPTEGAPWRRWAVDPAGVADIDPEPAVIRIYCDSPSHARKTPIIADMRRSRALPGEPPMVDRWHPAEQRPSRGGVSTPRVVRSYRDHATGQVREKLVLECPLCRLSVQDSRNRLGPLLSRLADEGRFVVALADLAQL